MSLAFLGKKSFNPTNIRNVEKVWLAEQAHEQEQKRLAELRKQIEEERQIKELQELQGGVRETRIDWMYEGPTQANDANGEIDAKKAEEYLLGKAFKAPEEKVEDVTPALGGGVGASQQQQQQYKAPSANEMFRRLHEDPLYRMKQAEKSSRDKILSNPVKMKRIRDEVSGKAKERSLSRKARKDEKKAKKKEKKERKRRSKKSKSRREKRSYSDSTSDASGSSGSSSDESLHDDKRRKQRTRPSRKSKSPSRSRSSSRGRYRYSRSRKRDREVELQRGSQSERRGRQRSSDSHDHRDRSRGRGRQRSYGDSQSPTQIRQDRRERDSHREQHHSRRGSASVSHHRDRSRERERKRSLTRRTPSPTRRSRGEEHDSRQRGDHSKSGDLDREPHERHRRASPTSHRARSGERWRDRSSTDVTVDPVPRGNVEEGDERGSRRKYGLLNGPVCDAYDERDIGPDASLLAARQAHAEKLEQEKEAQRRRLSHKLTQEEKLAKAREMECNAKEQNSRRLQIISNPSVSADGDEGHPVSRQEGGGQFLREIEKNAIAGMSVEERISRGRHRHQRDTN